MLKLFLAGLLGGTLVLAAAAAPTEADLAVAAAALPHKMFFGKPKVVQPRISPDGTKIAFLYPNEEDENRLALGLFDRKTNAARMILRGTDESIRGFFWKGNDRIVFYADVGGNESLFIASTDLTGRRVLRLAESQTREDSIAGATLVIESDLPKDEDRILVRGFFAPKETAGVMIFSGDVIEAKVNVRNKGISTMLTLDRNQRYYGFLPDHEGVVRVQGRLDKDDVVWEHRPTTGATWKEIARGPMLGYTTNWQPLAFEGDNRALYVWVENGQRGELRSFDTVTLTLGPVLFSPGDGYVSRQVRSGYATPPGFLFSPDGTRLEGVAIETDKIRYHWLDQARGELQAMLENTFPGLDVRVTSRSADGSISLVYVTSDREAGAYFLLDLKAGGLSLFRRAREIDPALMRPMEPIQFTARDGLVIHGYLTLPWNAAGRKVPLIIHPHGGPFGIRDSWGFDNDVQFLASRGYAVLQVNYRGSGGYGREFLLKGKQQWGRAMQDDLSDAVKWAIDRGIADPRRVGIYGASYGGYAALAGVTLTPELYACAVNYVGASDLEITFKHRGDDAYRYGNDYSYQTEWVGPTKEYRDATSPVNFVDRIRVPTMHVYGEKDPRVKIDHWTRLEPLLKKFNKPYVSLSEKNQGHGFADEKASLGFYGTLERFLEENLMNPKGTVKIGESTVTELPAKQ